MQTDEHRLLLVRADQRDAAVHQRHRRVLANRLRQIQCSRIALRQNDRAGIVQKQRVYIDHIQHAGDLRRYSMIQIHILSSCRADVHSLGIVYPFARTQVKPKSIFQIDSV